MANRYSRQSPPLHDQVPNQLRIGNEFPLHPDMLEPDFILSPVAGNLGLTTSWDSTTALMWRLWRNGLTSQIL